MKMTHEKQPAREVGDVNEAFHANRTVPSITFIPPAHQHHRHVSLAPFHLAEVTAAPALKAAVDGSSK